MANVHPINGNDEDFCFIHPMGWASLLSRILIVCNVFRSLLLLWSMLLCW